MNPWQRRLRRFLNRGLAETGLAVLLVAMDVIALRSSHDALVAFAVECVACIGAAVTPWWPRIGAATVCTVLAVMATMQSQFLDLGLFAPLIVVLSCAWHDEFRIATATTAWGYAISLFLSLANAATARQDLQAILLWTVFYSFPWLLGLALRRAQLAEITRAESRALARDRQRAERAEHQRHMLAAELHDNVTHNLALITVAAESTLKDQSADPRAALKSIGVMSRRTTEYVRTLMRLLQVGGAAPLTSLLDAIQEGITRLRGGGFEAVIGIDMDTELLAPDVSDTLGRIACEAINNVVRHGDPSEPCAINVTRSTRAVRIVITNATTAPYDADGLGLSGMRERASTIGASLQTGLSDGHWSVDVSLSVDRALATVL